MQDLNNAFVIKIPVDSSQKGRNIKNHIDMMLSSDEYDGFLLPLKFLVNREKYYAIGGQERSNSRK